MAGPKSAAQTDFEKAILARYLDSDQGTIQVDDKTLPVGGLTPADIESLRTTYGIDPVNYMVTALAGDDTIEVDEADGFNSRYGTSFGFTINADNWDHPYLRAGARGTTDTALTAAQVSGIAEGFKRYDLGAIMLVEDEPTDPRDCGTVILRDLITALADEEIYRLVSDMIGRAGEAALPQLTKAYSTGDVVVRARAFAAAFRIVIHLDKPGSTSLPVILKGLDNGFVAELNFSQNVPGFGFRRDLLLEALAKYDPSVITSNPDVAAIVPTLIDEAWRIDSATKRKKLEDVLLALTPVSGPLLVTALGDAEVKRVDFAHDCLVRLLKDLKSRGDTLAALGKRQVSPQDPGNGIFHPTSYVIRFHSARVIMDSGIDPGSVAKLFPLVYWGLERTGYERDKALESLVLLARREGHDSGSVLYDAIVLKLQEIYKKCGGANGEGDPFCAKLGAALRTTIREPLAE